MTYGKLTFAATILATAITAGAIQSGPASAAPPAFQSQLTETVKTGTVQEAGWRKRRVKRFVKRHLRGWRWCRNHPRRCHGRPWRRGYHAAGALCHRHLFEVPGMHFHPGVRCGHRHYRAYRSWVWAR